MLSNQSIFREEDSNQDRELVSAAPVCFFESKSQFFSVCTI